MSNKPKPLPANVMKLAEHARNTHVVDAPAGTTKARILESDFYSIVGRFLGRGDIIHVIDEAGCMFYELLVREGRESNVTGYISVALLREVELTPIASGADDKLPPECKAQWMGDAQKWAALRGGQTLRSGFNTKAEALKYFGDLAMAGAV